MPGAVAAFGFHFSSFPPPTMFGYLQAYPYNPIDVPRWVFPPSLSLFCVSVLFTPLQHPRSFSLSVCDPGAATCAGSASRRITSPTPA